MDPEQVFIDERLDNAALQELYPDDYSHAAIVFQQFVKSAPQQMAEIDKHFSDATMQVFREKVHKLKPVFSFVGLTSLQNQAAFIEEQCKNGCTAADIAPAYTIFKNNFSTSFPVVEEVLLKLKDEI